MDMFVRHIQQTCFCRRTEHKKRAAILHPSGWVLDKEIERKKKALVVLVEGGEYEGSRNDAPQHFGLSANPTRPNPKLILEEESVEWG
jgi:hypothetical protein